MLVRFSVVCNPAHDGSHMHVVISALYVDLLYYILFLVPFLTSAGLKYQDPSSHDRSIIIRVV
jgi:hypothetical protein